MEDLERYAGSVTLEELMMDGDRQRMVLNAVYTAAQASIDIAAHIVTARGLGRPDSYRELFPLLAGAGVIDRETASELARWAGLRNVVAHLYWKLHFEEIHEAMTGHVAPLRVFASKVADLVGSGKDAGSER